MSRASQAFALLSAASVLIRVPASAADFSGLISLTSDYRLRGVSQNDGAITPQLELDWNSTDDWTAGLIASRVNFKDGENTSLELDGFVNRHLELDDAGLDFAVTYFGYPDHRPRIASPRYSMLELSGKASGEWKGLSLSAFAAWSPDFFGEAGPAWDVEGSLSYPIASWLTASAHLGRQWARDWDRTAGSGFPYSYGDFGLTASNARFAIDLRYVATDLSRSECLISQGAIEWCGANVTLTLRYTFGGSP